MQIVPAQRELADQHAARRARMAAAAYRVTPTPVVIPAVAKAVVARPDPLGEAIKRALKNIPVPCPETMIDEDRKITIRKIIRYIAKASNIDPEDIIGPRRTKEFVKPRMVAVFCAWAIFPMFSLPKLGVHFGGRDHTTILATVRKMSDLYNIEYPCGRTTAAIIARSILAEVGCTWVEEEPSSAAMCADNAGRGY